MRQRSSGNVLLVVLVCLVAISLLGAGILRLTGSTLSNARHRETGVEMSSCVQAVRQFVSAAVKGKSTMSTDNYVFTIPGTNGQQFKLTAQHYDSAPSTPTLSSAGDGFGAGSDANAVENLANVLRTRSFVTGGNRTAVVNCTDPNGRVYEVEYRFVSAN